MTQQKLTPWFPPEIKPVRVGYYETEYDSEQFSREQTRTLTDKGNTARLKALLDSLIDADPEVAERFIESKLARLALQKRLAEKKAAMKGEK